VNIDDLYLFDVHSMFGCPYNFHPERPWLRRTIRTSIATGLVVVSPVLLAGAAAAATVALPALGIYRAAKHIRQRRLTRGLNRAIQTSRILIDVGLEERQIESAPSSDSEDSSYIGGPIEASSTLSLPSGSIDTFPLSIFASMDIDHLFTDTETMTTTTIECDPKYTADFRTCPTTPACNERRPAVVLED
jgi:hypothetical protein